ncbi:MAG: UDP-N-acetylmuramoyl-tripeptide--D-alanyl-D-alanine ligase [Actinobacteria bacterium]|uniref:UDP-MurNAc-pentapeptide synthetase n=1 Tax=freshwater metagenome TaxID=449393 RepID=A0A6J5YU88_9ZZZZ|nr:UDP-N-acetylmuramoyl-tripeptide--D-alanyl-D-alanine ligase [Actinomycetota bacterium]
MIPLQASAIAKIVGGELHGVDLLVTQAPVLNSADAIDGSLFLALKGENVDGHDFADDAFTRGAVVALVSKPIKGNYILVDDVTKALGALAHHVRITLTDLIVIGITGSQGKTTTKELLASVLSGVAETVAPSGNFNNDLGAPISLLRCTDKTRYCIVEMGARHLGDIAKLAEMTQPNIGVVLKVGSAHVGEFGSVELIAKTKSEMISSLNESAVAILGNYDPYTPAMAALHKGKSVLFGEDVSCAIRATDIEFREGRAHFDLVTPEGRSPVGLRIIGLHQVANALAVAAIATELGLSLDQISGGLSTAESNARWRMEITELPGVLLINDSYNASPEAMSAALSTLSLFAQERGGQSWAFLGKMHELGESSQSDHAAIGTLAQELGIDHLVCVGAPEYAAAMDKNGSTSIHICDNKAQALAIAENLHHGDVLLIKASRSEKLEELADAISEQWRNGVSEE